MRAINVIAAAVIIIWASIYAGSFAIWTWKKKNKSGSASILVIVAAMLILTVYSAFLRR